jgi:hypothetical protein
VLCKAAEREKLSEVEEKRVRKPREDMKNYPGGPNHWIQNQIRTMVFFGDSARGC